MRRFLSSSSSSTHSANNETSASSAPVNVTNGVGLTGSISSGMSNATPSTSAAVAVVAASAAASASASARAIQQRWQSLGYSRSNSASSAQTAERQDSLPLQHRPAQIHIPSSQSSTAVITPSAKSPSIRISSSPSQCSIAPSVTRSDASASLHEPAALPFQPSDDLTHGIVLGETRRPRPSDTPSSLDVSAAYTPNASSLVNLKDEMMMELLSSDALLHITHFEILGFDEVEELRKEHSLLQNRMSILTNKLAVEVKIRDATISMSKLYNSKRLSRQADDQVVAANHKVEAVDAELHRIARREAEIRTRILRHMAAVLGLSVRKLETMNARSPLSNSTASLSTPRMLPSAQLAERDAISPGVSQYSPRGHFTKFEGAHLYAGNKDAQFPVNRSPFTSPYTNSPTEPCFGLDNNQMDRSASALSEHLPFSSVSSQKQLQMKAALEAQIADLTTRLKASEDAFAQSERRDAGQRRSLYAQLEGTKERAQRLADEARAAEEERESLQRQLEQAEERSQRIAFKQEEELKRIQHEYEQSTREAGMWEAESRKLQDELAARQRQLVDTMHSVLANHAREVSEPSADVADICDVASRLDPDRLGEFMQDHLSRVLSSHSIRTGELQQNLQATRDELITLRQNTANGVQAATQESARLHDQVDALRAEHSAVESALSNAQADRDDAERALHTMQSEFARQRQATAASYADRERQNEQKLLDLEKQHALQIQEKHRQVGHAEQKAEVEMKALSKQIEALQGDIQAAVRQESALSSLRSIWTALPSDRAMRERLALHDKDDVNRYLTVFSNPQTAQEPFSADKLVERLRQLVVCDAKLLNRLAMSDSHAAGHKASSERAQRLLQESAASLQTYSNQTKEHTERADRAAKKEAQMLEQLNDLQDALEATRLQAKKADDEMRTALKRIATLEMEKSDLLTRQKDIGSAAQSKINLLQKEIASLREDVAASQDEVDAMRTKEQKQRVQLLDELSTLTEEAASLRTQLRTAQRKLTTAGL